MQIDKTIIDDAKAAGLFNFKGESCWHGSLKDIIKFATLRDARAKSSVVSDDREAFEALMIKMLGKGVNLNREYEMIGENDSTSIYRSDDIENMWQGFRLGRKADASKQAQSTIKTKPMVWTKDNDSWNESECGFHINFDKDEIVGRQYQVAWGEDDYEYFATLEDAKNWCQEHLEDWINSVAITSPLQSTEVANALEIAAKACDELGKSYGDRGYKAHPRSSDGIYDKCKSGKEASLLCAERVRNLITAQPTQSTAPSAAIEAQQRGWLVENGKQGNELRYRTIEQGSVIWTDDHMKAIRFARRADAELFAEEDMDAWRIVEHMWSDALIPSTQAPKESEG
ncbi:MAG: hypothetical protein V4440_14740 [Pseudomonadota bacterium]